MLLSQTNIRKAPLKRVAHGDDLPPHLLVAGQGAVSVKAAVRTKEVTITLSKRDAKGAPAIELHVTRDGATITSTLDGKTTIIGRAITPASWPSKS